MNSIEPLLGASLSALLLAPAAAFGQRLDPPERGFVEYGFRGITGAVDGRTKPGTVPFSSGFRPDVLNSGLNTYTDFRNSVYLPRAKVFLDDIWGPNHSLSLQISSMGLGFQGSNLIRDQAMLATFERHGIYQLQFRWDQTPHIFSGTTRTLYSQTSPGVWKFNGDRAALDAARVAATGAAYFNALSPQAGGAWLNVQRNIRRTGSGLASWNIDPNWNVALSFSRETQVGSRPHGMCFGNSPSCVWAEVPENIDYRTNTLTAATGFGRQNWEMQLGYSRQTFHNNITSEIVDNPFSNNNNSTTVTANGQMGLYPNNQAQNFDFGGAWRLGPIHATSSITPGWVSQNDPFVPYTTNAFLLGRTGAAAPIPLPAPSLQGQRQTLAMNYTAVSHPWKNVELAVRYRHYDMNNNTESRVFNPYVGDIGAEAHLAGPSGQEVIEYGGVGGIVDTHCRGICTEPSSFHTRDLGLIGTWFFARKSSAKLEFGRQWFNRSHRDVSQTTEDTFRLAVDLQPVRDLTFRIAAAHQDREPHDREYKWFLLPGTQRPDEGFRRRKRADLQAQYDLTDRLSLSGFFGTTQDDFNRRHRLTSLSPLGDPSLITAPRARPTPIYGPYYVYGLLHDTAWNVGGDFDFALTGNVTLFGEYSRERNKNRMVSRQRARNRASQLGCPSAIGPEDCDPINDWMTFNKDVVDTYYVGSDWTFTRKVDFSVYYSLTAAKGSMLTDGVNCQIGNGPNDYCRVNFPNWRLDNATNPVVTFSFPDNMSRLHEVTAVAKINLTRNLSPKVEYRYQRFDFRDFQTSVMNPFAYAGPLVDPAGATGLHRMLFLGADTPGYKAHVLTVTLEYRF